MNLVDFCKTCGNPKFGNAGCAVCELRAELGEGGRESNPDKENLLEEVQFLRRENLRYARAIGKERRESERLREQRSCNEREILNLQVANGKLKNNVNAMMGLTYKSDLDAERELRETWEADANRYRDFHDELKRKYRQLVNDIEDVRVQIQDSLSVLP